MVPLPITKLSIGKYHPSPNLLSICSECGGKKRESGGELEVVYGNLETLTIAIKLSYEVSSIIFVSLSSFSIRSLAAASHRSPSFLWPKVLSQVTKETKFFSLEIKLVKDFPSFYLITL